eukprot:TRINITY_DN3148_c0_g1_i1.p1 TRINITY_DN3148_c0_g1~~TRINITY_DN3148_c0_g1_i1.p1  ORF type:complete len:798 (+),score=164.52 TRINITY_DN3148_c0_g1_i1:62-2455(+)
MLLNLAVGVIGATVYLSEPPAAVPLEFELMDNVNPAGMRITANNNSMLVDGTPWVGAAGEVHFARLPEDMWAHELMKMKAGGLDVVDTYLFWIHHEEVQGTFNFTGRRNVRKFLSICQSLDLKVMMRVGPWCHGETRNGGHPDWLVEASKTEHFQLRANNTKYLEYSKIWYTAVAEQTKGMYFKDGGPVVFVQSGNENQNTALLESLRSLALSVGIRPVAFTVTSVNNPPKGFPFLQFVGAYPDRFWTNSMKPTPSTSGYYFTPAGVHEYPPLSVEIGGGMTVAYNHRVHMYSDDLPSWHHCYFGSGLNWMGYYMYHGGNNPEAKSGDAPKNGYQESSFQPAGAANPMPSKSYDFFAAVGEFGQIREHYHGMRQHGLFGMEYGEHFAKTGVSTPVGAPAVGDTTTLRWNARSDGYSGYIFVNNHQRLQPLPAKNVSGFTVHLANEETLSFPTFNFTVDPGVWFIFPFNLGVLNYATANLLCRTPSGTNNGHVFTAVEGIPVEISLKKQMISKILVSSGVVTTTADSYIFSRIVPSRGLAVSVQTTNDGVVDFVVIPTTDGERVWKGVLNGKEYLVLTDQTIQTAMINGTVIEVETETPGTGVVSLYPQPSKVMLENTVLDGKANGFFWDYQVPFASVVLPEVVVKNIQNAGPAREVGLSGAGKAEEPNAQDWLNAAQYTLQLSSRVPQGVFVRVAIRYEGDAARVSLGQELLTDNWFSGYTGSGEMQLGLSYLASEHPSLLDTAMLSLSILPIKESTLLTSVFLQKQYWPSFDSTKVALTLKEVVLLGTYKQALLVN